MLKIKIVVNKMKEQLITFDTAKLAKKAGVNIDTNKFYTHRGTLCESGECDNQNLYYGSYGAYTLSLLQKWFRDVHKIYVVIVPHIFDMNGDCQFCFFIYNRSVNPAENHSMDFNSYGTKGTYEKALEIGLQEAFKFIISQ